LDTQLEMISEPLGHQSTPLLHSTQETNPQH
jgi:hypothetical protein